MYTATSELSSSMWALLWFSLHFSAKMENARSGFELLGGILKKKDIGLLRFCADVCLSRACHVWATLCSFSWSLDILGSGIGFWMSYSSLWSSSERICRPLFSLLPFLMHPQTYIWCWDGVQVLLNPLALYRIFQILKQQQRRGAIHVIPLLVHKTVS